MALSDEQRARPGAACRRDHRPLPQVPVGAAAVAAPGAGRGGLRVRRRHRVRAGQLGLTEAEVTAVVELLHHVQAAAGRRVPRRRLHEHAVRGAGRRRHLRRPAGAPRRRQRRDDAPTARSRSSTLECNAACDYAPVMMVNWEFFDDMTPQRARDLVDDLRSGAAVRPSRGAPRLCSWRQAARILAGFPDGQAADGHTAGHASLAGLRIAREHGWAPPPPAGSRGAGRVAGGPTVAGGGRRMPEAPDDPVPRMPSDGRPPSTARGLRRSPPVGLPPRDNTGGQS